ncbi:MAG: modification methylase [Ruminococcaceae bacterium]|nr:modification methylase [Oscillospiraceae bacterium]
MAGNTSLRKADKAKNDEFYTQLSDIEAELKHYKKHFLGKNVLCNCDDPYESNFFKYFAMNFNYLGLKKLIATCYDSSPIVGEQLSLFPDKRPYMIQITEVIDENGDGAIDLTDVEYLLKNRKNSTRRLKDGDFRSDECIEALKEADIVVTNPPFSLFREYVAQLIEYGKKFLIIGNKNAITYKEIFPLLKENKMWLGYRNINADMWFIVPKDYKYEKIVEGKKVKHIMGCWFTNLDHKKRHEKIELYKKYNPEEYPKYDNYDAINVDKTADIPEDYYEKMGVPITFLDKYNPEQFEIIDGIGRYSILDNENTKKAGKYLSMIDGKAKFFRIVIKRR